MSLRAEYSYAYVFNPETREYDVTIYHQPKRREIDAECVIHRDDVGDVAERMIADHISFREENGYTDNEEQDRLAHKADHDNQCEKDLS